MSRAGRLCSRGAALLALAALVSACGRNATTTSKPSPETHPRLVVLLVVDQLSSADFAKVQPLLRRGMKTVVGGGVYYRLARFPFSATYTAPGHAAISTGAPPALTGILANSWYRRDRKRSVSAVADSTARLLLEDGTSRASGSRGVSGRQLQVEGVADVLRRATKGRGRSVSIAIKDRGAALALGKRPDVVVWYDAARAAMTTSSAYALAIPTWLSRLSRDKPPSRFFERVWKPLDATLIARHTGVPDKRPGEGSDYDMGVTFPYQLAKANPAAKAIRATPYGTEMLFDTAIAAIDGEKLGADAIPDILAISVSSHDYAGHFWGPGSWERLDIMLRLDGEIERLLGHLDRVVGKNRYAVLLTSDHGATPLVESSRSKGHTARRIPGKELRDAASNAASKVLGPGDWVQAVSASAVYVSPHVPAPKRTEALRAMAQAVAAVPGIAFAKPTDEFASNCDARSGTEAMACRSIKRGLSGDVYFVAARYHVTTTTYRTGTSHGSASPEDTDVPVVVYAPGRRAARQVDTPVSMLQVAPTLCALLGIAPPSAATARPLR